MVIVIGAPSAAVAQVQTVTPTTFQDGSDQQGCTFAHCTLREAVGEFSPPRVVNLQPGTYELTTQTALQIQGVKTINGAGATIDANNQSRVVDVVEGAEAIINDVTITGGNADAGQSVPQSGGGVAMDVATSLALTRAMVTGNHAGANGGGIFNGGNGPLVVTESTVSNNTAGVTGTGGRGAGIYADSGSELEVINSTISGNRTIAGRIADGAGLTALGALDLIHVTLAANVPAGTDPQAPGSSLAIGPSQTPLLTAIWNTIVVADTGSACLIGRTTTGDHNLDDDGTCGFSRLGDKPGVNPLLGALQGNGGRTATHALSAPSPAVDGADVAHCRPVDQRGVVRPQLGGCDIGAFEYVAPRLTVTTSVINDNGGIATSFTYRVTRSGADVAGSPASAGTTYTLEPGTFNVSSGLAGYTMTIGGDCSAAGDVTLGENEAKACTVVGNDNAVLAQNQLPPPIIRKSVNMIPARGTIRVKRPGQKRFRVLAEDGAQLPVGTVVNALKGRVTIVAASDDEGGTDTALFYGGIFRIGQTRGDKPTTILTMTEKLRCPKSGSASIAAKGRKKRRLWGDGSGKFRTKGKHSAATVVGTKWLVEDRCNATLTRVVRGRVSVRDFVKKKTVIVRAGKRYVARAG